MTQVRFTQVQHPVGQGGFHTGWIYRPARLAPMLTSASSVRFAWAYDCGSDQLAVLKNELRVVSGASFNVLFLSHLDADHVAGVDRLLTTAAKVAEVILPYLSDIDWALHLAAAVATGSLSGTLIDLAANPGRWFGTRGVERVTLLEGTDEDDPAEDGVPAPDPVEPGRREPEGSTRPRSIEEEADDDWSIEWTRMPRTVLPGKKGYASVAVLPKGAVAAVKSNGATLNWVLSPFAFKPSSKRMKQFAAKLRSAFPTATTAAQYATEARTFAGRTKLRSCYDAVFKNHNLHSMALYAGPARAPGKLRTTAWHGPLVRRVVESGWLSTGDFDLTVIKRRSALIAYYAGYAPMVGQFSLPHHGSDGSFDSAILSALPNLTFAIAAVGANGYGHPGLTVQATVASTPGCSFVRVDENSSSVFRVNGPVI